MEQKPLDDREDIMVLISVYDSVDGPKLRALYKQLNCSKFEALGVLNFLWLWGLNNADKDGRVINADKEDVAQYLRGVGAGCTIDSEKIVDALISTGWIDTDEGDLHIHDWSQWQRGKAESSDTQTVALSPSATDIQTSIAMPEIETVEKPKRYTVGFEAFWTAYPRKADKGSAYRKYQARRNDGYSDEELLMACRAYAKSCKDNHTEQKYIKLAKTFLSEAMPFVEYLGKPSPNEGEDEYGWNGNPFSKYLN